MHVLCPTVPTAPGLDRFSRRSQRLFAFSVHTRPRGHHPSMVSTIDCRAAQLQPPLGTRQQPTCFLYIMYNMWHTVHVFCPTEPTAPGLDHFSRRAVTFCWWDLGEGFGGGVGGGIVWWREMMEALVGKWRKTVDALVEALVEGYGGEIWWRDLVEAFAEGFGNWWRRSRDLRRPDSRGSEPKLRVPRSPDLWT
jgi:hypothetical protein